MAATPEDFVIDVKGAPLSRGYVSTPEEHWARVVKEELRKDLRNYILWFGSLLTILGVVMGGVAGFFGWALSKHQEQLERSIERLDGRVGELDNRTDSVAWKVAWANQAVSDYTGRIDNALNDYRSEFTRTIRETADLRGTVSSTLGEASRVLTEAQSARDSVYVMGDSVGRSMARVDASLGSLAGDLSRVDERVEGVAQRLRSGGVFDLRQGEPFDFPTTPLRVVFESTGIGRTAQVSVFNRTTGSRILENSVHLSAGQSVVVPLNGDVYRLTLIQIQTRLVGRTTGRFHVVQEYPPRE
jgi:hypothetical protein